MKVASSILAGCMFEFRFRATRSQHFVVSDMAKLGNCGMIIERRAGNKLTPVGLEPTQLALVELESTPLDHSGKVS